MNKFLIVSAVLGITSIGTVALACGDHGKKADANGDGKVTLAEAQASAAERFTHMDANKDGIVTADELPGRAKHLMERADANKDGKLTRAESDAAATAWFQAHDTNKDGALTGDEMPARGEGKGHGPHAERKAPRHAGKA